MKTVTAICFGGAAVLVALAGAIMANRIHVNPTFTMVGGATILILAGVLAREVNTLTHDLLLQRQSRYELLETQYEQQRRAVDDLADGLDVAVFICDNKAAILYANRRASEIFRLQNPMGRSILSVSLSYELEQLVIAAGRTGVPQNAELTFTYPDERMGLAKAWCPRVSEGRVFLTVIEITELRRLERVRQDFVANVSHELRTPMTLIRAMAETLLDEVDSEDALAQRYLNKTISEVDRLSSITQDLLVLSAAESSPVRKQLCDIAEVFRNVTAELDARARAKGLELSYEGSEHLPIEANPAQMKQVALNLVENAINYTHEGTVRVRLSAGDPVEIQVIDTGIGIGSEYQGRIFERFYRVDKGRARATGGTGLGLSIVKHLVEAHGGTLTVDSALGSGSTFTVRLPVGNLEDARRKSEG